MGDAQGHYCQYKQQILFKLMNQHVTFTRLDFETADELCPESYRVNSPDEVRLLAIADNFQRQYSLLYPDRKPLLLCPVNECGVKVTIQLSSLNIIYLHRPLTVRISV